MDPLLSMGGGAASLTHESEPVEKPVSPLAHLHERELVEHIATTSLHSARRLERMGRGARNWKRLSWDPTVLGQATACFKQGHAAEGFWLYNDGPTDAWIGLTNAGLNASTAIVTVRAGTSIALPIASSVLYVTGASAGTLVVFAFEEAPAVSGTLNGTVFGPGALAAGVSTGSFPVDHPYAKGKAFNAASIGGGGAFLSAPLVTANYKTLTVLGRMTATAAGDLGMFVFPYEDDDLTVYTQHLTPDLNVATSILNGGVSAVGNRFELNGVDRVAITMQNNNVAAETLTVVYYLMK